MATVLAQGTARVWRVLVAAAKLNVQHGGPGEAAFVGVARGQGRSARAHLRRERRPGRFGRALCGRCRQRPWPWRC
jgi:hypothetical protein